MIYIWYFDRQDAIQSAGFNFIHDLPRFLVLLLIMQRLPYAEWGHNPLFGPECGFSGKIDVWDEEKKMAIDLEFDFRSPERTTHYGLRGRATNVFPVKSEALSNLAKELAENRPGRNETEELVAKIYWPEETRQSEADILKMVHEIAAKHPKVKDHVPDVIWSHKFADTSTAKIREALGIDFAEVGGRALYIIVFRKLRPITALSGDEFLRAWWHALACKCFSPLRCSTPFTTRIAIVSSGNGASVIATSALATSCFTVTQGVKWLASSMTMIYHQRILPRVGENALERFHSWPLTFSHQKPCRGMSSTCTSMMLSHSSGCLPGSVFDTKMVSSCVMAGRLIAG